MIFGMGGSITFPVGTVGAARQAEAIINSLRPGSAAVGGFIPQGKGDNDVVPTFNSITVGTKNYDASYVENLVKGGDTTAILNLLGQSGISVATDTTINKNVTATTPYTVRSAGFELVEAATPTGQGIPTVSTPTPSVTAVASGYATGNVVNQVSQVPTVANTTSQSMTDVLSGQTFGQSNTTLIIGAVALVAVLYFMGKN